MDLWQYLQSTPKKIVLYGMGNGADKLIAICEKKHITLSGVFVSDGFVRDKMFHGWKIQSYKQIKEQFGDFIVLVAFGTALPEVIQNIENIAFEQELYIPDIPLFDDVLFDEEEYAKESVSLSLARNLLSDEESKVLFDNIIQYRLTGKLEYLQPTKPKADILKMFSLNDITHFLDLGAYNGDSVRELAELAPNLLYCQCWEPDAKNFANLSSYADTENRFKVECIHLSAWSEPTTLHFQGSHNRNAHLDENGKGFVPVDAPDNHFPMLSDKDRLYVKFDVEGAEEKAILGCKEIIAKNRPSMLISLYHKTQDIHRLPLLIHSLFPFYKDFRLSREKSIPGWDLYLLVQ